DLVGEEGFGFACGKVRGGNPGGMLLGEKRRTDGRILARSAGEQQRRGEKEEQPDESPARHRGPSASTNYVPTAAFVAPNRRFPREVPRVAQRIAFHGV